MYEETEYFKRFAKCYLLWAFSNFDRIVIDAVQRQERIKAEEDKAKRLNTPAMRKMRELFKISNDWAKRTAEDAMKDNIFFKGTQWAANAKVGATLRIKLPKEMVS